MDIRAMMMKIYNNNIALYNMKKIRVQLNLYVDTDLTSPEDIVNHLDFDGIMDDDVVELVESPEVYSSVEIP